MAIFPMTKNDTAPAIQLTLTRANVPIDLTNADTVQFIMKAPGSVTRKVDAAAAITTAASGLVTYDWVAGDTDTAGTYDIQVKITWNDATVESVPNAEDFDQVVIYEGL